MSAGDHIPAAPSSSSSSSPQQLQLSSPLFSSFVCFCLLKMKEKRCRKLKTFKIMIALCVGIRSLFWQLHQSFLTCTSGWIHLWLSWYSLTENVSTCFTFSALRRRTSVVKFTTIKADTACFTQKVYNLSLTLLLKVLEKCFFFSIISGIFPVVFVIIQLFHHLILPLEK